MAGSEQPQVDYYFRKERLSDDGGERAHARIVEALPKAKAGGLLSDFRVMEHAEAFPTHAEELAVLKGLRKFSMVKRIALGRRFGSNKTHFGWFPARALLVSVGGELRNVFPCELENGYVEPEDFLESLLKRDGQHTAPSNAAFDASLRDNNPEWGVRDIADVEKLAAANGLRLAEWFEMPANNLILMFANDAQLQL